MAILNMLSLSQVRLESSPLRCSRAASLCVDIPGTETVETVETERPTTQFRFLSDRAGARESAATTSHVQQQQGEAGCRHQPCLAASQSTTSAGDLVEAGRADERERERRSSDNNSPSLGLLLLLLLLSADLITPSYSPAGHSRLYTGQWCAVCTASVECGVSHWARIWLTVSSLLN